jgi:hypothetical protein
MRHDLFPHRELLPRRSLLRACRLADFHSTHVFPNGPAPPTTPSRTAATNPHNKPQPNSILGHHRYRQHDSGTPTRTASTLPPPHYSSPTPPPPPPPNLNPQQGIHRGRGGHTCSLRTRKSLLRNGSSGVL